MTQIIPLTRGRHALVDDEDYEHLSQWKWHINASNGYAARSEYLRNKGHTIRQTSVLMHRVILGAPAGVKVDHINHDRTDNRRRNLRLVDDTQHNANKLKKTAGTSSRFKGVVAAYGKWRAYISFNRKRMHLGTFTTEEAAARAYNDKARELFGEYAHLNTLNG